MLIYNSLTRKKEEFIPLNPPAVTIYMCGPTVYDYFHVGNGRSFIMADVIRRYLEYKGFTVKYVMNLTDIDDKIIKKANSENSSFEEVSRKYTEAFFEDIGKLGIKKANVYPKATEHIQDIVALVDELIKDGYAYNIDGNVFYDVKKFNGYGKLSGKKIDELESGSRVEINESKLNPLDFSLWKKAKTGEPSWSSPWGDGRPGWHIECSAMSMKLLGKTIDIHAGGSDLIFPHHENEIAQCEASTGKEFVKYWIHFGFLTIKDEKMSKSLGNFFTVRDILKKYSGESLRLFFNQTHYAGPLSFSEELIQAADKGLEKINNLVTKIEEGLLSSDEADDDNSFNFDQYYSDFEKAMDDDFNTPIATSVIFDFVKSVNIFLSANETPGRSFYGKCQQFLAATAADVLGIVNFDNKSHQKNILQGELIELLLKIRTQAKTDKNFTLADEIRDELKNMGIMLEDSKAGTIYRMIEKT